MKEGQIRISSENMMPIIKKWLYSDKDIFLREIVANGIDAITKYKKLITMSEATENEGEKYCVKVSVDKKAKTLTVEDNGIGMTEEEIEKYITQIAFSGANDFLAKYENAGGDGIIGHFGLGFYSAYMVSELVEIETKSYKKDAPAVKWASDGNSSYTIDECSKEGRGTKIIMHISDEEKEFLSEVKIKELVRKYCSFMPYDIFVNFKGDGKDEPLNTTAPLYTKAPKDCTDEEYTNFYTDTFKD
ncbi:MAG: ATP-binding protein, partial [Clostridia bacterium]|nr:ATP-binding protein [Clostridia bacterium]